MKVACYFTGRSAFGGAERRIGRIMNGVAAKGVHVDFVFTLFEDLEHIISAYKHAIGTDPLINFIGFTSGKDVFMHVLKEGYDVVFYVGVYKKMLPFYIAAKIKGSRTVLLQVSTGPSIGRFDSIIEKVGFNIIASNSTYIDCLYPSTTSSFKRKFKHQIVNTTPCPGTDINLFYPKEKEKIITFISRWVKGKNVELFVKSILSIENELYDSGYKVYLCGKSTDGIIENNVNYLIRNANHPDIFIIPGYVNPEDILPKSEIFISIQDINNYPSQSLLEAIACGCYIVASDEGDTDIIVKPAFGVCCSIEVNSVAKEIQTYINKSPEDKEKIILFARSFAEKHFDLNDSINHYLKIINQEI